MLSALPGMRAAAVRPGGKLQIDFGQSRVYISGQLTTVHYLVGVLCHGRCKFCKF